LERDNTKNGMVRIKRIAHITSATRQCMLATLRSTLSLHAAAGPVALSPSRPVWREILSSARSHWLNSVTGRLVVEAKRSILPNTV